MNINLKDYIRNVPNFPKKGVNFKDISPLLANTQAFAEVVAQIQSEWNGKIDVIAGLDARGFIIGGALAYAMKIPFVMMRKGGKLPGDTMAVEYKLEYGNAVLEAPVDAFTPGSRVLIVDDLLATGGTAAAACALVYNARAQIAGCAFVIELSYLDGRKKLEECKLQSLVKYNE